MVPSILHFILASAGLLKLFNIGWNGGANVQIRTAKIIFKLQ